MHLFYEKKLKKFTSCSNQLGVMGKNSGKFWEKILYHNHKLVFMVFLIFEKMNLLSKDSGLYLEKIVVFWENFLYHNHKLVFMVFHMCNS